ncbi:FadR/GntR family transcriptional regulator [Opacimonas viscosa]|uniref:FadR family transcriptional regulator n=1 Tax=Opacimonas viscosa TaxID=2961944 RepID=A0AA41X4K5_9ALTE|nr:FadR/GntR family transcriptional regulator [Opacimonas viscosa]MCP3429358.1 FadR family transcriptional regulator [Opacimonas viscosa]
MKNRRMFWNIADKIEELIQSGQYAPGSRLPPERELAEKFGVSRPTIREAIIALEVMQLVEVKTSSGVYVLNKSAKDAANESAISAFELTQARALIEGEAAALAAKTITPEELDKIEQTLVAMEAGINADQADRDFHYLISAATRNNAMLNTIKQFWAIRDSQPEIKTAYESICKQSDYVRSEEHRAIFNALKSGNSQAARSAMHAHFNRLINSLIEATEARALEEVRKATNQTRDLYSLRHIL